MKLLRFFSLVSLLCLLPNSQVMPRKNLAIGLGVASTVSGLTALGLKVYAKRRRRALAQKILKRAFRTEVEQNLAEESVASWEAAPKWLGGTAGLLAFAALVALQMREPGGSGSGVGSDPLSGSGGGAGSAQPDVAPVVPALLSVDTQPSNLDAFTGVGRRLGDGASDSDTPVVPDTPDVPDVPDVPDAGAQDDQDLGSHSASPDSQEEDSQEDTGDSGEENPDAESSVGDADAPVRAHITVMPGHSSPDLSDNSGHLLGGNGAVGSNKLLARLEQKEREGREARERAAEEARRRKEKGFEYFNDRLDEMRHSIAQLELQDSPELSGIESVFNPFMKYQKELTDKFFDGKDDLVKRYKDLYQEIARLAEKNLPLISEITYHEKQQKEYERLKKSDDLARKSKHYLRKIQADSKRLSDTVYIFSSLKEMMNQGYAHLITYLNGVIKEKERVRVARRAEFFGYEVEIEDNLDLDTVSRKKVIAFFDKKIRAVEQGEKKLNDIKRLAADQQAGNLKRFKKLFKKQYQEISGYELPDEIDTLYDDTLENGLKVLKERCELLHNTIEAYSKQLGEKDEAE